MFETAHIPNRETRQRKIACLNPADTRPDVILPVTRPKVKECRLRGVRRVLYRVTNGTDTPIFESAKNWMNMTVVPVNSAAPMYGTMIKGISTALFSISNLWVDSANSARLSMLFSVPPPTSNVSMRR